MSHLIILKQVALNALIYLMMLLIAIPAYGSDQQALEVLEEWKQEYEASIEGIDDYVVERENQTVYYKKAYDNGRPYFKSRVEGYDEEDLESTSNLSDADLFSDVYESVREQAEYRGTEELNGFQVHVIYVEEMEEELFGEHGPQNLRDIYLRIDPDKWVLREIEYTMDFEYEDELRELTMAMNPRDYRAVEGMQVSYETRIVARGLALTEEERRDAEERMEEFEQQLEDMPEERRQMVEQMAGDRIEQARSMLEDDHIEMINRVESVRVNTGMEEF